MHTPQPAAHLSPPPNPSGPTYVELQDTLDSHGVAANVKNAAIGGTLACGWEGDDPDAITTAARSAFPLGAPDLVWFTAGGNDMAQDTLYHECLDRAATMDDASSCSDAAVKRMIGCTQVSVSEWKRVRDALNSWHPFIYSV